MTTATEIALALVFSVLGIAAYAFYNGGVANFSSLQTFSNFVSTNLWQTAISAVIGGIAPRVAIDIKEGLETGGYILSRFFSGSSRVAIEENQNQQVTQITESPQQNAEIGDNNNINLEENLIIIDLEESNGSEKQEEISKNEGVDSIPNYQTKTKPGTNPKVDSIPNYQTKKKPGTNPEESKTNVSNLGASFTNNLRI